MDPSLLRKKRHYIIKLLLVAAFSLSAVGCPRSRSVIDCVRNLSTKEMMLEDGRIISSDAKTAFKQGGQLFIIGDPTLAWRRLGGNWIPEQLFGLVRSGESHFRGIPMPSRTARFARAVPDGKRGLHAIFFELKSDRSSLGIFPLDSVEAWYAHYDGVTWSEHRHVTNLEHVVLSAEYSSGLLRIGDHLYFAAPFEDARSAAPGNKVNQGIFMLHFMTSDSLSNFVQRDSLLTWGTPRYVQLSSSSVNGRVLVLFAQPFLDNQRPHPSGLFATEFERLWGTTTKLFSARGYSVLSPRVDVLSSDQTISWQASEVAGNKTRLMSFLPAAIVGHPAVIAETDVSDGYGTVRLSRSDQIWLLRKGSSRDSISFFRAGPTMAVPLGSLAIPFDNPTPFAVAESSTSMWIITGKAARSAEQAPASSVITKVTTSCRN